jgi:hypothetical protein
MQKYIYLKKFSIFENSFFYPVEEREIWDLLSFLRLVVTRFRLGNEFRGFLGSVPSMVVVPAIKTDSGGAFFMMLS